jgi:hypothetical protein
MSSTFVSPETAVFFSGTNFFPVPLLWKSFLTPHFRSYILEGQPASLEQDVAVIQAYPMDLFNFSMYKA